jgi:hypothetical protein
VRMMWSALKMTWGLGVGNKGRNRKEVRNNKNKGYKMMSHSQARTS